MRRKSRKSEPENKSGSSESDENHANGAENEDATSDVGERDPKRRKSEKSPRKSAKNDKKTAKKKVDDEDEAETLVEDKKSDKNSRKATKNEKKATKEQSDDENEEQYEVEALVDMKITRGVKHYLVRWKGFDMSADTWEAEDSLNCPDLIADFEKNIKDNPKRGRPRTKDSPKKKGNFVKKGKSEKGAEQEGEENDIEGEFEVDKIIEVHHKRNGKKEFLVSWKGYPRSQDSWVDEEDMDCKDLISRFMAKVDKMKSSNQMELRENRLQTDRFTLATRDTGRRLSKRNTGKQRVQYHNAE